MNRSRSRSDVAALPATSIQLAKNGSTLSTAALYGQYGPGKSEIMTDVVTPQFKRKRSQGSLINSPMTHTTYRFMKPIRKTSSWIWAETNPASSQWGPTANVGFTCNDPIALRFGRLSFPDSKLPSWNASLANQAIARARSNAAAPEAHLLVTLGEARETFALLANGIGLLLQRTEPFRVLRRRYERGQLTYKDFLAEAANLELLVRYGVMPLLYDINGYVKAFTKARLPDRRTSRATETDSGSQTWTETATSSMLSGITLTHSLTWNREYRATCLYESADDLQSRVGLRLADIPTAAWELRRLSFVADWFANIQDFLESLTLAARANVVLQCVTESITAQYIAIYSESAGSSDTTKSLVCNSNGSGSTVNIVLTRKTRSPVNTNDPGVLTPRLKLTPARILDGLSLLATNLDISSRKRLVRI